MTLGHSQVLAPSRNTIPYSLQESGCGLIQPTHLRLGVSPPYKKPIGGKLTPDQKTYNYHVSKVWLPLGIHETSPYWQQLGLHTCWALNWSSERPFPGPLGALNSDWLAAPSPLGHHVCSLLHHLAQPHLADRRQDIWCWVLWGALQAGARRLPTATRCWLRLWRSCRGKWPPTSPSCTQNRWHPISQSCAEVVIWQSI